MWESTKKAIEEYYENSSNLQMAIRTITKNSFVQSLIIFFIGFTILYCSEVNSIGHTVAITIMSASVFKFLLTSNAFTIQISKILKPIVHDNFVSLDFINTYKENKLLDIVEKGLHRFFELEFPQGNKKITNEFMKLIRGTGVYFEKSSICLKDTNKGDYVESITTKDYIFTVTDYRKLKRIRTFSSQRIKDLTNKEHFTVSSLTVDGELIEPSITYETSIENSIEMIRAFYEWPELSNGNHTIQEVTKMADTESIHIFSFSYPCLELNLCFEHDKTIIKPIIFTKFGRQIPSIVNGKLETSLKDGIILPNEKIFISYEIEKGLQ